MNSLEMCAGAGGQALGLERAGFDHEALIEWEAPACSTLRLNRPHWNVIEGDLTQFDGRTFKSVDLVAGSVRRPHFLKRVNSLCDVDERNLSPGGSLFVKEIPHCAVTIENVRRVLDTALESRSGVAMDHHG